MTKPSLPSHWLECPRLAPELIAGKFLVFKTPLSNLYDDKVHNEIFHVSSVFEYAKSRRFKLGLWVCLTATDRYYDFAEVKENSCKYTFLKCVGQKPPSDKIQRAFKNFCLNFTSRYPDEVIGVHCTHGFNRTGFLIISYLVEILKWNLDKAIAEFVRVRPPGIYRENILFKLYEMYKPGNVPHVPALPDWCKEQRKKKQVQIKHQSRKRELKMPVNWVLM